MNMIGVESTVLELSPVTTAAGASLVPAGSRMNFLPRLFGARHMLKGEFLVYDWMGNLCQDYNGGLWNFYTVKNKGYYMAPADERRLLIRCCGNGFEGEMTSDAAGIVATLFTLSQLSLSLIHI
jgi:hypothetical protein